MRRIFAFAFFSLLATCIFRVQAMLDVLRKDLPAGYEILYLPSGKYLQLLTFGYQGVFADFVYLWSIQYTTNLEDPDRFKNIEQMYKIINELDPQYVDPYQIGAMEMIYELRNPEMAFRLLDRGIRNLPNNWSIAMDAGFYAYMQEKDYDRAVKYFDIALSCPDAPTLIHRLRADMFRRKGDLVTARNFWGEIYKTAVDERTKRISYNHYFDLVQDVDIAQLRHAIDAYTTATGHRPARLSRLIEEGFLQQLPRNLEGEDYLYDPRTGKIDPPTPFKLNRQEAR